MISADLLSGDYDSNYDYFLSERGDMILAAMRRHILEPRVNILKRFETGLS